MLFIARPHAVVGTSSTDGIYRLRAGRRAGNAYWAQELLAISRDVSVVRAV